MKNIRFYGLFVAMLCSVLFLVTTFSLAADRTQSQGVQSQTNKMTAGPQSKPVWGQFPATPTNVQPANQSAFYGGGAVGCVSAANRGGKSVKLMVKDTLAVVGGNAEFRAILTTDAGVPISGALLAFVLNGKELGKIYTSVDGQAVRKFRITPDIKMDGNVVEVRFLGKPGNPELNCTSQTARLLIVKAVTALDAQYDFNNSDFRMIYPHGIPQPGNTLVRLKGRLIYKTESGDSPIAGKIVSFSLDGKKATALTDNNGYYTVKIDRNPAKVGKEYQTEQLEYSFTDDSHFLSYSKSKTIEYYVHASGAPPPFFIKSEIVKGFPFTLIAGRTTKVEATLWYGSDKKTPVANQAVKLFAIKKDPLGPYAVDPALQLLMGEATTDASGRATFTYTYQGKTNISGNYATYADDGSYDVVPAIVLNGKSWAAYGGNAATIIIVSTYLDFEVNAPASAKAGEKIDISVRAIRKGDKKPMEGVSLALFSPPDNARTIAVTDKQGYAYFSVTKTDMGSGNKKFSVVIDPGYKNESDVFSGGKEFYINILPADNRKSVNIDVHDVIVNFGEKALFGATAKSGRDLLVKDAKLGFSIYRMDGVLTKYCEAVTNNSGIGECSVWAFVPAAKYNIEVLYNGLNTDNGYLPAKGKGVLTVNKAYRPIEATYDVTTKPFTLIIGMDNWGGPVTGETFTITLDKTQTYTRHAASDGKFWLEDKNIHEGMSVVIEFAGTYMLKPAKYTGMIQGGKLVGSSIQVTETPRSN